MAENVTNELTVCDEFYDRVIQAHREVIEQDMKASLVLIFLPHLVFEVGKELVQKERESHSSANKFLLDKILEIKGDGWFQSFIDGLNNAGFEQLAARLQLNDSGMLDDERWKEVLSFYFPTLMDIIDAQEIMGELYSKQVIGMHNFDTIRQLQVDATIRLLLSVPDKREDWFPQFLVAVTKCQYDNVVNLHKIGHMSLLANNNCDDSMELEAVSSKDIREIPEVVEFQKRLDDGAAFSEDQESSAPSGNLIVENYCEKSVKNVQKTKSNTAAQTGVATLIVRIDVSTAATVNQSPADTARETRPKETMNQARVGLEHEGEMRPKQLAVESSPLNQQVRWLYCESVNRKWPPYEQVYSRDWSNQKVDTFWKQADTRVTTVATDLNLRTDDEDDLVTDQIESLASNTSITSNTYTNHNRDLQMNQLSPQASADGPVNNEYTANISPTSYDLSTDETDAKTLIASEPAGQYEGCAVISDDTIVIRGLSRDVTKQEVVDFFSMSGDIPVKTDERGSHSVEFHTDPTSSKNNNIVAYLSYVDSSLAGTAVEIFNGSEFKGFHVQVSISRHCLPAAGPICPLHKHLFVGEPVSSQTCSSPQSGAEAGILEEGGERKSLALREYQKELAAKAINGENCIIVAPTGSGKTLVALEISKQHFAYPAFGDEPKVAFFVPTVALVDQQKRQFAEYLKDQKTLGLSGDQDGKLPLSELVPLNDIIVMTPQILENALKGHPYNAIMSHFMDEMFEAEEEGIRASLPQIVGLTASVGVGKAKTYVQATDYILKLCANLHARSICTVKENILELRQYVNRPDERTEELRGRKHDPFNDTIGEIMRQIEDRMKRSHYIQEVEEGGCPEFHSLLLPPPDRGSDRYTQWIHKLDQPVASIYRQEIRRFFVTCLQHLMWYNNALLINADCRTIDALNYLERERNPAKIDNVAKYSDDTDKWLDGLFSSKEDYLRTVSRDPKYENPKLNELKRIITEYYHDKPDSRGIIFCKTRDLTEALVSWMKDTRELCQLNPDKLVGSNAPANRAGITQDKQDDVLQYFKEGRHKIIVATSVAEEGLDVQKCNVVIRYEHVTNLIARVQARGRARAAEAQYLLLAEKGRGTADKEEFNKIRETMMQKAIEAIDDMSTDDVHRKIRKFQKEARVERAMAIRGRRINKQLKQSLLVDGNYEIRCHKCDAFAAYSNDIRKIEDSHHVIIDETYHSRIKIRPHPAPKKFENFELTGKIYCLKCHNDWGMMALYKKVPFPVVKICSFIVTNVDVQKRMQYKRWKDVPFKVNALEEDDLERMMIRMTQAFPPPDNSDDD